MKKLLFIILLTPILLKAQSEKALDFYSKGVAKFYSQSYEEAIELFTTAISLDPDFQIALFNRGQANVYIKSYEAAIKDFDQVLALDS